MIDPPPKYDIGLNNVLLGIRKNIEDGEVMVYLGEFWMRVVRA